MKNDRKIKILKTILLIYTLLTILLLWSYYRLYITLESISLQVPIEYREAEDGTVKVTFPSGKTMRFTYGNTAVRVADCKMAWKREDTACAVAFIRSYAKKHDIPISRSTLDLIGEYRLHAILSEIGYQRNQTDHADLDYVKDERWYVRVGSAMIGVLGF